MKPIYKIMFIVSVTLMVTAAALFASFGLNLGVDFRGGSVMELQFKDRPTTEAVSTAVADLKLWVLKDATVNPVGADSVSIKSGPMSEQEHQQVLTGLKKVFEKNELKELRFDSIGPAIGDELRHASVTAIILVILAIAAYIALVFRAMSRTLSPWVMSLATMVALAHDVLLPIGVFAYLGKFHGVELGAVFVAAILTIMGYSISDTVVVFDRVRENIIKGRLTKDKTFGQIVHESVMQTLVRSINTNITVLVSLVAIYFFGGQSIRYFALALIIGIFSGAYSSIFVASPLLVWLSQRQRGRG